MTKDNGNNEFDNNGTEEFFSNESIDEHEEKTTNFDEAEVREKEEEVKKGFWKKLKSGASKVPFVLDSVGMYYCLVDQKTPMWAKGVVAGALGYFILPTDAIPDFIAGLGYTDDAGVVAGAVAALGSKITDEHKDQARLTMVGEHFNPGKE